MFQSMISLSPDLTGLIQVLVRVRLWLLWVILKFCVLTTKVNMVWIIGMSGQSLFSLMLKKLLIQVVVGANDYSVGLFNGDDGVIMDSKGFFQNG